MKFSDGYWLLKPGVTAYSCTDIRDIEVKPDCVTMYVTPWKVYSRGQTLEGPLLTLCFTAPHEGVLELSITHFAGGLNPGPAFEIYGNACPLLTEELEGEITIKTGKLTVVVSKETFRIDYYWDDRFLTASEPRQLAYITTLEGPFMREHLLTSVDEKYYGFGERFTPFVKNGQSIDIWNEDGGTASEQAYKNIPFCLSNRVYGVFVNHPELVSYEVCSEAVSKLQFSVAGENLRYMVVGGDSLYDVINSYTNLTGKPALPPAWSYGLWLSTSFTTNYNEETVMSFIDGMIERDIPLSVFHFDCFWMKEYEWCNFQWDTDAFPDPVGMLARIKAKGLKICVWINPYIGQKSPLFAEGAKKGYLIKNKYGGVWQWDKWQPGLAIVDFTNPEATAWYQGHLRRLMEEGVDCFKTDFGERIPVDCVYHDGSDPMKMHNFYAFMFNKAVFDVVREVKGDGEAVLFARSATAGGQQFPVHWGGDCDSNYVSMAESLRGGLSLSACGFGFWSHDIGGFENTATPDVYKRWVAFGLMSSHSRLHGSISYRVPWLFDDESVDVLQFFTKMKNKLMPYIFSAAHQAHTTGVPVMRPMVLAYPSDPVCGYLDMQYMFGDSILVAPVFNKEGTTQVYLPETECGGLWTHFFTEETHKGGTFVSETHGYFSLGLWAKPNSLIAMGDGNSVEYNYADSPVVQAFEISNAEAKIYNPCSNIGLKLCIKRDGNRFKLEADAGHNGFSLQFRGIVASLNNVECDNSAGSTLAKIPTGLCSAEFSM